MTTPGFSRRFSPRFLRFRGAASSFQEQHGKDLEDIGYEFTTRVKREGDNLYIGVEILSNNPVSEEIRQEIEHRFGCTYAWSEEGKNSGEEYPLKVLYPY